MVTQATPDPLDLLHPHGSASRVTTPVRVSVIVQPNNIQAVANQAGHSTSLNLPFDTSKPEAPNHVLSILRKHEQITPNYTTSTKNGDPNPLNSLSRRNRP